jgi:ribonucleoside-diphosphate reductase alpha chain
MAEVGWQVRKRSGALQVYAAEKIAKSIYLAQGNIGRENWPQAQQVAKLVIAELESRFAQEKILGTDEIGDCVERVLIDEKLYDIARAYIIAREKQRQEMKAEKGLGVLDDVGIPYNSVVVLRNKYLRKDKTGRVIETPRQLFFRVARALAKAETGVRQQAFWRDKFFELMVSRRFLPGGRTLANAGTVNGQLANCFVMSVPDSVEGIFEIVKESSILKKNGGGVGFSFSRIRPKGDVVATTSGRAAGPVAFMRILNDASDVLQQAGGRRSGNMVVLHVTHPDIIEFITCKEDEAQLPHINFSLGATDKFMEAVKKDRDWNLVNPRNGAVVNTVAARSILELAASYAWRNGDPGMVFLDRINQDNPTPQVGVLEAVNLCGEQPLLAYEACNLGSVNLALMVKETQAGKKKPEEMIDWKILKETVQAGVRLLDNAIEVCRYPLAKVTQVVKSNRKIGLGVMGWADMLVKLSLAYNSDSAIRLAKKVMKFIQQTAWRTGEKLGKEKGSFPNFKGSIWQKRGYKTMRNATLTTIAPTGSISMVAGCSYGIEPHFALAFYKEAMGGVSLPEINEDLLNSLRRSGVGLSNGLLDQVTAEGSLAKIKSVPEKIKKVFVTAHELEPKDHVRMQSAFQKYTDNAVSKTINLRADSRVADVMEAFMLAWQSDCKGITVYRDMSRSVQVLNVGYNKNSKLKTQNLREEKKQIKKRTSDKCPQCGKPLFKAEGCATCPSCAFSVCSL